jgi:uncharacterized membrane protein
MTQTPSTPPPNPPQPTFDPGTPSSPTAWQMPADVVQKGKLFGILCYACNFAGLPFWIVPLAMRDNAFSLYHAKQCFVAFLIALAVFLVSIPLAPIFCIGFVTGIAAAVFLLVCNIIGLINVSNNVAKPLPIIGRWGEDWFKGITLQEPPPGAAQ